MIMWPFNRKPAPALVVPQVKILLRDRCEVTLKEWRQDQALVSLAATILADPNFKLMLDCANNSGPHHWALTNSNADERAAHQGRIEGYLMALTDLKSLGMFQSPEMPQIEPDFKPELFEPPTL